MTLSVFYFDKEFHEHKSTFKKLDLYKRNVKVSSSNFRSVKSNFGKDINPIKWMKSCAVYIALGKYIINERKKVYAWILMHRFLCHSLRFYTSISGLLSIPRKKVLRVCNNHFFSAKWQRHKTETLSKQLLTWFLASFWRIFSSACARVVPWNDINRIKCSWKC